MRAESAVAKKSVAHRTRVGTNRRLGQTRLTSRGSFRNSSSTVITSGVSNTPTSEARRNRPMPTPSITPARIVSTLLEDRSEEHTSELQSLMRISYAVFDLKKKKQE